MATNDQAPPDQALFFAPVWKYTDKATGASHDLILLREELKATAPEGFSATLDTWRRGGVMEFYEVGGLVLTGGVARFDSLSVSLGGSVDVRGLRLPCVFLSGPLYDAWLDSLPKPDQAPDN